MRIDDNKPLYLLDETPWSEWTYSAAFFFDPNSIVMKNGNVHNIFVERNGAGLAINIVQFRRFSNQYQLRFQTRTDGAAYVNTPWQTIWRCPHRLAARFALGGQPAGRVTKTVATTSRSRRTRTQGNGGPGPSPTLTTTPGELIRCCSAHHWHRQADAGDVLPGWV